MRTVLQEAQSEQVPLDTWIGIFFFNDTATTEIYTLSLHDALPISPSTSTRWSSGRPRPAWSRCPATRSPRSSRSTSARSEEHTSELQSQSNLVCRLLLEKKQQKPPLSINYRTLRSFPRHAHTPAST